MNRIRPWVVIALVGSAMAGCSESSNAAANAPDAPDAPDAAPMVDAADIADAADAAAPGGEYWPGAYGDPRETVTPQAPGWDPAKLEKAN
jgi:hypothetical protein